MVSTPLALELRDLVTRFYTGYGIVQAVDGVTLEVHEGETLGLVGESGSGKSVTAMSILRLVPPPGRIVSGVIRIAGNDVRAMTHEELRRMRGARTGMVFQNPMTALNPVFTVGWQLREALRAHNALSNSDAQTRVLRALAEVGMPDAQRQSDSYPHQMSGGMRQRVVIAMALANQPKLLIADEATTALDVTIQAQVLALMRRLVADKGAALLLITHNMGVVAKMCDRVAVMYAGEVVEEVPVHGLFADPRHPYTWGLLSSIPRVSMTRGSLTSMPGSPPDMTNPGLGCRFAPRCPLVREQCMAHPQLIEVLPGHKTRCWIAQEGRPLTGLSFGAAGSLGPSST
jgi:oligopeptide/dipeptide ABC transporter ATP-binding protein